jgi:hypothetical protein
VDLDEVRGFPQTSNDKRSTFADSFCQFRGAPMNVIVETRQADLFDPAVRDAFERALYVT